MDVKEKKLVLFGGSKKQKENDKPKKRKPLKKLLTVFGSVVALLIGLYCAAIFSNIPFIKTWRDLYIETAMDTYSHKWLATLFIPQYLIDEVMAGKKEYIDSYAGVQSSWAPTAAPSPSSAPNTPSASVDPAIQAQKDFLNRFYELDKSSFADYIAKNPALLTGGYDNLLINEAGLKKNGTSIKTTQGDQVVVLDAENGIIIVKVTGDGFVGKLAIIRNPAQVRLGVADGFGSIGETVSDIAKGNHSILAVNASGFADPEWEGNGGQVVGLVIQKGKTLHGRLGEGYLPIGFSEDNWLYIGVSPSQIKYRDAVEFMPPLIVNGKNVTDGSTGFGIQPRTTIGQASDGTVFLLTIDGRQVGYSLGTTVGVCAEILHKYGAIQASNLDGGSSTIMIYRDEIITKTSGLSADGRLVPDAFIVDYASDVKK